MLTSRGLERSRQVMTPRLLSGIVAIGLFVLSPGLLAAGQGRAAPAAQTQPPVASGNEENARDTRERLRELLDEYPPSVAQVLRLDPSLLSRSDYLSTYPKL